MHKNIDLKITSIFSPICQTLIYETVQSQLSESIQKLLKNSTELLIIRLNNTVIGYALFELVNDIDFELDSIHFRSIIKNHTIGEYCFSRLLARRLKKTNYKQLLLAS
tara:strand:+ start:2697 stop:3020 length:324 start_codon:yes stop_codon:yes gene_type:complete